MTTTTINSENNHFVGCRDDGRTFIALSGHATNPFIDVRTDDVTVRDGLFIESVVDRSLAHAVSKRDGIFDRLSLAWLVIFSRSDCAKETT